MGLWKFGWFSRGCKVQFDYKYFCLYCYFKINIFQVKKERKEFWYKENIGFYIILIKVWIFMMGKLV